MTPSPATATSPYIAALEAFEKDGFNQDPGWARALRKEAIARFSELGFPTARRGNEEWKYTDVRPIAQAPFRPPTAPGATKLGASALKRFTFGERRWHRLVFVDGSFNQRLSFLSALPTGVKVLNLAEALKSRSALVREHLAGHADYSNQAFTALNTAFVHDGAFVHIPDGAVVEEPIHILFLTTSREKDTVSHPRVLVVTGRHSKATIIESYGGSTNARYLSNAVSEVVVGPGASVEHYRIQRHSEKAYHVGTTQAVLGRDGHFSSVTFDLGGALVRNNLNVLMGDEGSSCMLNGVYLVTRSQKVDNQVTIDHAKAHTTSRELYKGVLAGQSRAVFHGSIIVRRNAQKVDARQEDKNLLLSDQAEANIKPAFWIYADDVKCGHGAATGRLDESTLFYLRSRGLSEDDAQSLLVRGFVNEVIETISCDPLRAHIGDLVTATLQEL